MSSRCDVSVVVPVFDEEEVIEELVSRVGAALERAAVEYELIFVNDGSKDGTLERLRRLRAEDGRIKLIDLSRNFGHQIAVTAGLDHARGDAVVVMDADLQDPPELLPELIARWREGYQVVYTVRQERKEGLVMRVAYAAFYRLLRRIADVDLPVDSGDFALMDRAVVEMLTSLPERNRYVRGLRSWVGFRQTAVEYERAARAGGRPKYTTRRLVRLAFDGIFSFSEAPLQLARNAGLVITCGSALLGLWTLIKRLILYEVVPGFATLALLVLFFGGVQLVSIGILGEYVARIYTEVKARHRYVIRSLEGVDPTPERHGLPRREHTAEF